MCEERSQRESSFFERPRTADYMSRERRTQEEGLLMRQWWGWVVGVGVVLARVDGQMQLTVTLGTPSQIE